MPQTSSNLSIFNIEALLSRQGFYAGTMDGIDGPILDGAVVQLRSAGSRDQIKSFQGLVGVNQDGIFGDLTTSAWRATKIQALEVGDTLPTEHQQIITSKETLWTVEVDGDDLVVSNGVATAFGGDYDAGDNGMTACGYPTRGHPDLLGCSLPENIHSIRSLNGSPIPRLPYGLRADGSLNPGGAMVVATFKSGLTTPPLPVLDVGPSLYTDHILDLTVAAARLYRANANANDFEAIVSYRILGAAKYIAV